MFRSVSISVSTWQHWRFRVIQYIFYRVVASNGIDNQRIELVIHEQCKRPLEQTNAETISVPRTDTNQPVYTVIGGSFAQGIQAQQNGYVTITKI